MDSIIEEQVSLDLQAEFPQAEGFSTSNLWYMKRWYLCPQVRVADIVQLNGNIRPRSRQWWQLFRMVSQWHVDVVIVERRSFSIVAAVELDDASHLRPERRRRDILLEEVLRQAGIPLLRSHDARKLLQMTGEWLNTTGADQQSPEHRS